jgi:hypothetical protein
LRKSRSGIHTNTRKNWFRHIPRRVKDVLVRRIEG